MSSFFHLKNVTVLPKKDAQKIRSWPFFEFWLFLCNSVGNEEQLDARKSPESLEDNILKFSVYLRVMNDTTKKWLDHNKLIVYQLKNLNIEKNYCLNLRNFGHDLAMASWGLYMIRTMVNL